MRLYTERGRVRIPLSDSYFAEPLAAALSGKQGGGEEAELEHTARPSPCLPLLTHRAVSRWSSRCGASSSADAPS